MECDRPKKWREVQVAQPCATLFDPMDCHLPGSSVHGDSPGKNTGVGCRALLQRIFPTQGSNLGLLHLRQILYRWATREALISHSRKPGSKWVTTQLWLSESLRFFGYSSSVYSCHLFLISSASVRFLQFLSFIMPILAWNVPLTSPIFLRKSLAFPILL